MAQVVTHKLTGKQFAMKTVDMSYVRNPNDFEFVMKEVRDDVSCHCLAFSLFECLNFSIDLQRWKSCEIWITPTLFVSRRLVFWKCCLPCLFAAHSNILRSCIYTIIGVPNSPLSILGYGPLLWRESTRKVRRAGSLLHTSTFATLRLKLIFCCFLFVFCINIRSPFHILHSCHSYRFTSEKHAAGIVLRIVNAVRYCHDHGIAHRDLKLENVLLVRFCVRLFVVHNVALVIV